MPAGAAFFATATGFATGTGGFETAFFEEGAGEAAAEREDAPDAAGLPAFAVLVAGTFTRGLLWVPDDAVSGGRALPLAGTCCALDCTGCTG